ncbi:MAG: putative spermidine/putrescine transport system substrate-binding protein [Actinomycetota bacterium]|nr:putative spermidine/putrescine transport system substrate-binding protein [Actinomycetota bacterium]
MPAHPFPLSRRSVLLGAASGAVAGTAAALTGCGAPSSNSTIAEGTAPAPARPSKPVSLSILDVAGNRQLTQPMIDEYARANPQVISKVTYSDSPSPDLIGKIKAQQGANRINIHMVLTGVDGLSAGIEQGLWTPLLPLYADRLTGMRNYLEPAAKMQGLAGDHGIVVTYYPSGPLLEYLPDKVAQPPDSARSLLAYAKAHKGRVQYARPSNSGPGRTFLMGLPYVLGDTNPADPENGWPKTWEFLKELGRYIDYYPSSTSETMKNLASGTAEIIVTTTGWDINPRVLGTVPANAKITTLQGFVWVTDAHYVVVPKGVAADHLSAVLNLLASMLTPEQQAKAYDDGYFYPGPAIKGVDLSMAPEESRKALEKFGRPEYDQLITSTRTQTPLEAKALVRAFDIWDREIGSGKVVS